MTENMRIAETYVAEFRCPSDTQSPTLGSSVSLAEGKMAPTNYDFVTQSCSAPGSVTFDRSTVVTSGTFFMQDMDERHCNVWRFAMSGTNARMFGQNSTTTPAHVRDGLSNTFAVCETTVVWAQNQAARWAARLASNQGNGIEPSMINNWTVPQGSMEGYWHPRRGAIAHNRSTAASLHPGGCQMLMGDGAVRFLSEQTAFSVLNQLKRMRDGNAPQDW
jgi:prepilin-type processing-associated H-X9-DG protein